MSEQTAPTIDEPDVMQEVLDGDALTLSDVASKFPSHRDRGKKMDPSAAWRWMRHGAKAVDGTTVKLESVKVGTRNLTSGAALKRFIARLSKPAAAPAAAPAAGGRSKRSKAAAKKLQKMGA